MADLCEHDLASYAMRASQSNGRRHSEPLHPFRSPYQRDRDRIVHSTAFRRLMHKTQVLVTQTNDHHRTRLTHTLEVSQIARTLARRLRLNEDLTEAIALSHDLGHPPFGHAGEDALDECMRLQGGFEHNLHALRIVDLLEYPYPTYPGLNLTWEVREAMALHSKRRDQVEEFTGSGRPLLEAQIADAADSLAYDTHDIDDALGDGLIAREDLEEVTLCRRARHSIRDQFGELNPEQWQPTLIRTLIDWQVLDLLEQTEQRLKQERIESVEDVRVFPGYLVGMSAEMRGLKAELERFLRERVYHHVRVERMARKGGRIVRALFSEFTEVPALLPHRYRARVEEMGLERVACDYIAGMTDRFAQDEHLRLFHPYTPI